MKVEIMFTDITKLTTRTRFEESLVTTIQFDTKLHPAQIARIINLQRQGAPLLITIGSPQATMDLNIQEDKEEAEPAPGEEATSSPVKGEDKEGKKR